MPRQEKQPKLHNFFSSSPIKAKKPKHKAKLPKEDDAATVISTGDESDAKHSKLAPSSQITTVTKDDDSDASNGQVEMSPITKRRRQQAAAKAISDPETSGSDDYVPLNLLGKRKIGTVEDSEDDKGKSPAKRRKTLKKGLKPLADEENLTAELDPDAVVESRLRTPAKTNKIRDKALERIRRKRLGLPAKASSESETSQESSEESDADEIEVDADTNVLLIPGARRATQQTEGSSSDADTDDFVVDDEGDAGEAIHLPAQFSRSHAQSLDLSFKVFFQFLVHTACQPAHLRKEYMTARLEGDNPTAEYWRHAANQLRRTLGSIRDSQVASTIWKADFRNTLETFPNLDIQTVEMEPYCDACRKITAVSTRRATLDGEAYNKVGFEPLGESSDEDSEEEEDEDDSSASSEQPVATTFNLGQHCARRVALFHEMYHLEYTLFQAIEAEIVELETSNRQRLLKAKKKKVKGLIGTSDPDGILEWMEERGMVNMQWKVVDRMIQRASRVEMRRPDDID